MEPVQWVQLRLDRTPREWFSALLHHCYLALAIVIALPGNAVIGGVGGIDAIAGTGRQFRCRHDALVVLAATTLLFLCLLQSGKL
jgi:hypothetical protein